MTPTARVFVVGCPRSGTTLLQAALAAHPAVLTLPETFYFRHIFGRLWPLRSLGVVSPRSARRTLARVGADLSTTLTPPHLALVGPYAERFTGALDEASRNAGATVWVEKSPGHLHCLDIIDRHVAGAAFVHVVRDGRAVAASFYQACRADPERWIPQAVGRGWRRRFRSPEDLRAAAIDGIARRWNGDLAISSACVGTRGHDLVVYEELVADPRAVLEVLCSALGLEWDEAMLDHTRTAGAVVGRRSHLAHMSQVRQPIVARPAEGTFASVFAPAERQFLTFTLSGGGDPRRALGVRGRPA